MRSLVALFIKLKHAFPGLWIMTENVNSAIFSVLHKKLDQTISEVLPQHSKQGFIISKISAEDINELIEFRRRQDNNYLVYFDPHPFDRKTIERLLKHESYVLMQIRECETNKIVGYFFLRCFFIGKAFHGLITDQKYINMGLGTMMWKISMDICNRMGLRMYATVSSHNTPSLKSASNATKIRVTQQLANDFLLIECTPQKNY